MIQIGLGNFLARKWGHFTLRKQPFEDFAGGRGSAVRDSKGRVESPNEDSNIPIELSMDSDLGSITSHAAPSPLKFQSIVSKDAFRGHN